jgi:Na+-driven multidrug efflux pump
LCVPFALSDVFYAEPFLRIYIQDSLENIFAFSRQYFGCLIFSCHNFFIKFAGIGILEGEIAAEHGIEYDAAAPNISS